MENLMLNSLIKTGAFNKKLNKAIIWHPLSLFYFLLLLPVTIAVCLFIDEGLISAIRNNFTFKK